MHMLWLSALAAGTASLAGCGGGGASPVAVPQPSSRRMLTSPPCAPWATRASTDGSIIESYSQDTVTQPDRVFTG